MRTNPDIEPLLPDASAPYLSLHQKDQMEHVNKL